MRRTGLVVAAVLVVLFAAAGVALAYTPEPPFTNVDCRECHEVTQQAPINRVDFDTSDVPGGVDYEKCKVCHLNLKDTPTNFADSLSHHHYGYVLCSGCHSGGFAFVFPGAGQYPSQPGALTSTPYGYFQTSTSLQAPSATLHSVHGGANRVENAFPAQYGCTKCHARATCTACHASPVEHGTHGSTSFAGPTLKQADGSLALTAPLQCVNASCHDLAAIGTPTFSKPSCPSCHPSNVNNHGYDEVQHTANVSSTVDGGGKVCGDCHKMALFDEHQRPTASAAAASCVACHPNPRQSFPDWDNTCSQGACHATGSAAEPHAALASAHATSTAAAAQVCYDCHDGDLTQVHANAVSSTDSAKTSCLVCHSSSSVPATNNCTTCHFTYDAHPYPEAAHLSDSTLANCGGSGCHTTRDLLGAHQEKNPAYVCNDCHGSARAEVQAAIASGSTACSDCHPGVSETVGHRAQHAADPALVESGLPQYAFLTGSAPGGFYTSACAGCHTSNLIDTHLGSIDPETGVSIFEPQKDIDGDALTCRSCHDSTDPYVVAGISAGTPGGTTKCDQCHKNTLTGAPGVHGAINQVHTSTFMDAPPVKCTPCHTNNLVDQHDGGMVATGGDGRTLVYCDICHDNYGGTRGPIVQGAIEIANDVRCTACHSAAHPDFNSHAATSAASLECGSCHAEGQTSIDIKAVHANASAGPCAVCHDNSARVPDVRDESAECASCHATQGSDYHRDFDAAHAAPGSQECVDCHETANVVTLHSGAPGNGCVVCHDNAPRVPALPASTACANCHGDHSPVDPAHYPATSHIGAEGTESGFACSSCHKLEMKPEHFKTTSGPVSCVQCHETKVDALGGWDGTCADCHSGLHGDISTVHDATGVGNANDCGGSGCHEITNLRAIHANSIAGNAPAMGDASCATANCHTSDSAIPSKKSCDSEGCHAGTSPHRHELDVSASEYVDDEVGGCTDTADGCHGTGSDPSYATYHPNSGCVSGACHTAANHNDPRFDDPNSCQNCHGGGATLYDGAPNVSSLLGSSPSGHYKDDRHTPVVNDQSMRSGAGGTVLGYCRDCHNPNNPSGPDGVYVQHSEISYWPNKKLICFKCHNHSVPVSQVVKTNWSSGLCSECHNASVYGMTQEVQHATDTAPAVIATEAQGAGACVTSGCHATLDLHALHKGSASTSAGSTLRTKGCGVTGCHDFTKQAAKPSFRSCGTGGVCHNAGDPHSPTAHVSPDSGGCLACHEAANNTATTDVRQIAMKDGSSAHAGCSTCHNSGANLGASNTADCVDCHNGSEVGTHSYSPTDPNHYPASSHAAAETACNQCHYLDLKQEHLKPTSGPVSCVQCHESKVDGLTSPWNGLCTTQCHATKHGAQNTKHVSTNTTCGGTGCHVIGDVSSIHQGLSGGGCNACHKSPSQPASTTNCSTSGCHDGVSGNHHAMHDTTGVIDTGCKGCHFTYLDDEHAALGLTCATCHSSTSTAVAGAIAANDRNCLTCHPDSAHNARQSAEFTPSNASMHRISAALPGMRSSFIVNGSTYTMSLPSASSFLKSGYAMDSVVTCNMCHIYSGSTGPHGATMKVNIDPAYPNPYKATGGGSGNTAQLSRSSSTGMSMSDGGSTAAKIICEKCHDLNGTGGGFSNVVHSEHDDRGSEGSYCNHCHVSIPHGWGRPRLIGYTTDSAAYRTTTGGLQRISLKNYTPSGWDKSDCGAGCSSSRHPVSGSTWPNLFAQGSLTGRVTDSGGNPISGATVTIAGDGSATTASNGTYTITGAPNGSVSVTASKTGYTSQTKTATINAGQATTLDFALAPQPVAVNLALNKPATASSQYSSSYGAAKAVDGSASTYWQSSSGGTQWIRVDLGSSQSLSKVVINWSSTYYARSYRVETSTDGTTWTQRYSTSSGTSGVKTHTFAAVSARYVRIYCTSTYASSYRVNEFEVWNF